MQSDEKDRFYILIGNKIKDARVKANLTQENFAGFLNLSRASIVNIERGRQHPTIHLLWEIARILNVSLIDLLPTSGSEEKDSESDNDKWKTIITLKSQGNTQTSEKLLSFIEKLQRPSK